jgi:hypothetical protein
MENRWEKFRKKILSKILELFKVEEGQILPKPLKFVFYLFFPSRAFWKWNPWFCLDECSDRIKINGTWISIGTLIGLLKAPSNRLFRIKERGEFPIIECHHLTKGETYIIKLDKDNQLQIVPINQCIFTLPELRADELASLKEKWYELYTFRRS